MPVNTEGATGDDLVVAERRRQTAEEGWTPEHDDAWTGGELVAAARCYKSWRPTSHGLPPAAWPWDQSAWKPKDRLSNLVRAGALLLAEAERCERAGYGALTAVRIHEAAEVALIIDQERADVDWRPVNPEVCKHAGPDALVVERNQGYRWVTCTLCLTEFVPVDPYHIVNLGASDFSVQHPVTCRPDLTACDVHTWLRSQAEPPAPPGRYRVEQADVLTGGFTLTADPAAVTADDGEA